MTEELRILLLVGGGLTVISAIIWAIVRANKANSQTNVSITDTIISGKGFVDAKGRNPVNDTSIPLLGFSLTYDMVTGVTAKGSWLVISASGLQHQVKTVDAENLAAQIESNLRKHQTVAK